MDFDLSVTICSWNTKKELSECLTCLLNSRDEANFEVIVVDNGSSDGSADMVEQDFPWVRLIRSETNLGFTGGHNLAIKERKGSDCFLLNSDAFVHPGCISSLLSYQRSHPEVGIIGPKILNPDGSLQLSCRRFPNPIAAAFRNTFLGKLFPKNRFVRNYLMTEESHDVTKKVDWVSGAAFYVSENLIQRTQGLDEAYFMFCEDMDWCWRSWKLPMEVHYLPKAVVTHIIGKSTDKAAVKMIVRFHRSVYHFYSKNMVASLPWLLRGPARGAAFLAVSLRGLLLLANHWKNQLVKALRKHS